MTLPWRRLLVVALLVVVAGCERPGAPVGDRPAVQTVPQGATVPASRVGFSPGADILWMPAAEQARELDLMAATGVRWLRLDFPWPSVEPERGAFNWEPFDRIVAAAQRRGFQIVGIPGYTPGWASQAVAPGVPPVSPARYADLLTALATRYGPRGVHVWELWNEPNLSGAWGARPDAKAYTALLTAGSAAARRADPAARVLSGGLAPAVDAGDGSQVSPLTFVRGIYAAGGGRSLDAVAIHPYSFPAAPRDPTTAAWNTYERLPLIHDVMVANGDAAKQIWLTEFGAPTGTAHGAVSLTGQATTVRQGLLGTQDWDWVGAVFWYAARDRSSDPADREGNFGLVREDFSAKPAYTAFTGTVDDTDTAPATFDAVTAAR